MFSFVNILLGLYGTDEFKVESYCRADRLVIILNLCFRPKLSTFHSQLSSSKVPMSGMEHTRSAGRPKSATLYLRQHRMIHADCKASAVGYAALP